MEEKIISSLDGVSIYGIISILIFFIFFSITLVWVFALKKNYLNHMGELPLDASEQEPAKPSNPADL